MRSVEELVLDALGNRFFAGVTVPIILTVVISLGKAAARPRGPGPWSMLARPRTSKYVRVQDKAVGLDLMAAAIGSQIAFLAAYETLTSQANSDNLLMVREFGLHIRQLDLSFLLLGLAVLVFVALTITIRHKGYYENGTMKEDLGCHVPNWFGYGALVLIYGLNPV
jgi:hypothetical protein